MSISNDNKRIPVTLPKEIYDQIQEIAKKDKRSISNLIGVIVEKYLEENEGNNNK